MMSNAKIGTALVGGYLLGRTKKAKLAIGLGMFLAGKKLSLDPQQLLKMANSSPLLSGLNEQVRSELVGATKSAATSALTKRVSRLSDSLHERTRSLSDPDAVAEETVDSGKRAEKATKAKGAEALRSVTGTKAGRDRDEAWDEDDADIEFDEASPYEDEDAYGEDESDDLDEAEVEDGQVEPEEQDDQEGVEEERPAPTSRGRSRSAGTAKAAPAKSTASRRPATGSSSRPTSPGSRNQTSGSTSSATAGTRKKTPTQRSTKSAGTPRTGTGRQQKGDDRG
ncbi:MULTISPECIES: hypothetical protein [unclassified Streptomyces]|uniref:hypothetical protein n=1 Tax=unclassified Streptomyces TaxID=2593676 RepID=UPI000DB9114B|nr:MULTISPECIES: hypothetical protein [unclassified Streptomyces]RAJ72752.1 hypothetical protein K377_07306 [Streptomyces sp. PsTaAH-137]